MELMQLNFNLVQHIKEAAVFSQETFGPGARTHGVIDHIKKELVEIEKEPDDIEEWIDVVILALDGAARALVAQGVDPNVAAVNIVSTLQRKTAKNRNRKWPDWRKADPNKAIEHIRDEEAA